MNSFDIALDRSVFTNASKNIFLSTTPHLVESAFWHSLSTICHFLLKSNTAGSSVLSLLLPSVPNVTPSVVILLALSDAPADFGRKVPLAAVAFNSANDELVLLLHNLNVRSGAER